MNKSKNLIKSYVVGLRVCGYVGMRFDFISGVSNYIYFAVESNQGDILFRLI